MSSYRVLLFAGLRDALGPSVEVALPGPVTVGDLLATLTARHPVVSAFRIAVAVNLEVVALETRLTAGDEVALLPPVGGG